MIVDTSALLSALFPDQRKHDECAAVLAASTRRVVSPFVLAEADYLVLRAAGPGPEAALLGEIARGVFELAPFSAADVDAARRIIEKYADLRIGLADASLVVLADRHGMRDIFTLDERCFRTVRRLDGGTFRLLPADV